MQTVPKRCFCGSLFFLLIVISVILSCMFCVALWKPAGKGLASLLLYVMFSCVFVTFPYVDLGQVLYLIVWIYDLCHLPCFDAK